MKKNIYSLIIILFILMPFFLFGQNSSTNLLMDSLRSELNKTKHDTTRLHILNDLTIVEKDNKLLESYFKQIETIANKHISSDSSLHIKNKYKEYLANSIHQKGYIYYYQGEITKALEYYIKSLKIREEIGDKFEISTSLNNIGLVYYDQGNIPKALEYHNKSLKIREEINDKSGIANSLHAIGNIFKNQGNILKALDYFNRSLKISEEIGDKYDISASLNSVGLIYYIQHDNTKALKYFNKSLKIKEEINDKMGISIALNNIGDIYYSQGNISKTLECYNKGLEISEEIDDKMGVAIFLNSFGSIYFGQNNFTKAIECFNKSLKIFEKIGDKSGMSASLNNLGDIYLRSNQTEKALGFAKRAYNISKEIGYVENIKNSASVLDRIYAKQGNYKYSRKYYGEYIEMRDSIHKEENQKKAQQMFYQYQYEKKAVTDSIAHSKAIEIKTLEISKQRAENKKQQIIILSAIIGFLVVTLFSVILFRMFHQKRKANFLLATQNAEINQQKEEISAQRDEISVQRDIVIIQKDHIEDQKKEITDSINYAKRIQQAVLPSGEFANNILGDHFILFKPKDIVSGDFYWGTRINEWLIVTVADCTGHGVPGAFMSMLGVSFLNEIVRKKEITKASDIIYHLRESVIEALQQKGTSGEQKDGMDMALCVINTYDKSLQFSGANNSIIIITTLNEIIEIEPNKMPVAIHENMDNFTNNLYQLHSGDCIYLASDGYEDQFGGPKNKKFMAKQLKELLLTIVNKPMSEQHEILDISFENWKSNNEQIDDVTILGIRI